MLERRKFVRLPEAVQMSYTVLSDTQPKKYLTRNISQEGISFYIHEFVPENSFLKVKVTIKQIPLSFECLAKVIWVRKSGGEETYEAGVKFVDLPREMQDQLVKFIRRKMRGSSSA